MRSVLLPILLATCIDAYALADIAAAKAAAVRTLLGCRYMISGTFGIKAGLS